MVSEPEFDPHEQVHEQAEFPCRECGANLEWNPVAQALACDYCGAQQTVPVENRVIEEYPLEAAGAAARGYGAKRRVADCKNCGARTSFEGSATARHCVFCGSSNVLEQDANRNAIRPESVVPMDVGRAEVKKAFRRWLKKLWFRPNALQDTKRFDAIGVYVPFWTFDCHVESAWSADSGTYYYVTVTRHRTVNGKRVSYSAQERRVRWTPAWGERSDDYDDVLVNASHAVSEKLLRKLGGFRTTGLVPYQPAYLAGWRAEEYRIDLEHGWDRGRGIVVDSQERRCAGDVPGDTHRHLRVSNELSNVRWKHILLPLWTLTYRFKGKTYPILINGQTGRVSGDAPYSVIKITFFVLLCMGLVLGLLLLFGAFK